MNFYVEIVSSKAGKCYPRLMVDIDGVPNLVSFDRMLICNLLDVSPKYLSSVPLGTRINLDERSI